MKFILKIVLIIGLILVPYSCVTQKFIAKYPVNSKCLYYDGVNDSTIIYIDHYSLIEGVYVRDTEFKNDTTIVGWTLHKNILPIKENIKVELDQ